MSLWFLLAKNFGGSLAIIQTNTGLGGNFIVINPALNPQKFLSDRLGKKSKKMVVSEDDVSSWDSIQLTIDMVGSGNSVFLDDIDSHVDVRFEFRNENIDEFKGVEDSEFFKRIINRINDYVANEKFQ
jgi:hypothetical protein